MTTDSRNKTSAFISHAQVLKFSVIPIILALLALCVFSGLAHAVMSTDSIESFDAGITRHFIANRDSISTGFAQIFSFMGGIAFILPAALLLIAALWVFRFRRESMLFVLTMGFTSFGVVTLKLLFGRIRPESINMLGPIDEAFSFPSGHTMHATVFFGLVMFLIIQIISKRRGSVSALSKTAIAMAWLLICIFVATSRVYLGYHWFTDVVAGFLLGVVVLAFASIAWQFAIWRVSFSEKQPG